MSIFRVPHSTSVYPCPRLSVSTLTSMFHGRRHWHRRERKLALADMDMDIAETSGLAAFD